MSHDLLHSTVFVLTMFSLICKCSSNSTTNSPTFHYLTGFVVVNQHARQSTYFDFNRYLYVPEGELLKLRLFGNFTSNSYLKLSFNTKCQGSKEKKLHILDETGTTAEIDVVLPKSDKKYGSTSLYFCLREGSQGSSKLQGRLMKNGQPEAEKWLTIKLIKKDASFPLWADILIIIFLLSLSGLFSGLNLGLLSLEKTDLKLIINTGSQRERSEALAIVPVRNHGNFLLCTLLFSNVFINTMLTLAIDRTIGGSGNTVIVVLASTILTVLIGEIIPQAICSRHGLTVGAKTIWITKFFMTFTFPISYPIGKLLDAILGEEVGSVYTRDRLKEIVKISQEQNGLESEEIGIIAGALDIKSKTVKDIMLPLDNVFMVSSKAALDVQLLKSIEESGFTRIPVYQGKREDGNIVGVLNVKNLTLYDPSKVMPVIEMVEKHKHELFGTFESTRLDYMLRSFREGTQGHMAFVQKLNDEGPGDPRYETIGLVTLEDVLEELLQVEIYDENDLERMSTISSA